MYIREKIMCIYIYIYVMSYAYVYLGSFLRTKQAASLDSQTKKTET